MTWHVKNIQEVQSIQCSLAPVPPTVYVEQVPRCKVELLMDTYTGMEWCGYLTGYISDKGNIFVEDLSIPPHEERTPTSATAEPFHVPANCVGFVHSHHQMGAFHSGTDKAYVDKNYPTSITVAKKAGQAGIEYDAVSYLVTPCGKATTGKSQVKYVAPKPLFDTEKWLAEAKANIDKPLAKFKEHLQTTTILDPDKLRQITKQGRDDKGRFLPVRYQQGLFKNMSPRIHVIDQNGHVLTQTELNDIEANSGW